MIVRGAKYSDIDKLLPLVEAYIDEQGWDWGYSKENSVKQFAQFIENPECAVLYLDIDGEYKGCALVCFGNEFHPEAIGHINYFYISKDIRGTKAGRVLAKSCNDWFDFNGCVTCFASATARIKSQDKLFMNLMGKYDYKESGQVLARG